VSDQREAAQTGGFLVECQGVLATGTLAEVVDKRIGKAATSLADREHGGEDRALLLHQDRAGLQQAFYDCGQFRAPRRMSVRAPKLSPPWRQG